MCPQVISKRFPKRHYFKRVWTLVSMLFALVAAAAQIDVGMQMRRKLIAPIMISVPCVDFSRNPNNRLKQILRRLL